MWTAAAVAIGLVALGEPLLRLWTLDAISMNWMIFIPLLAVMVINGVSLPSMMLVYATNRHARTAVVYVLINTVLVAAAYGLGSGSWIGLAGIAVLLVIAEIILAAYVVLQSIRLLGDSPAAFFMSIMRPPTSMIRRFLRAK